MFQAPLNSSGFAPKMVRTLFQSIREIPLVRFIKQIPVPLRLVCGAVLLIVTALVIGAGISGAGRSGYDLIKDIVIPLVSPIVAIFIPTILFYVIPLTQNQQKGAIDLFTIYNDEEMRIARNEGWTHFVTDRDYRTERQQQILDDFLRYLIESEVSRSIIPATHAIYQRASRVLDFFAVVNGCLERNTVERQMIRTFLGYYYLSWRDEIMIPLRERSALQPMPRYIPSWWYDLTALDELCDSPDRKHREKRC